MGLCRSRARPRECEACADEACADESAGHLLVLRQVPGKWEKLVRVHYRIRHLQVTFSQAGASLRRYPSSLLHALSAKFCDGFVAWPLPGSGTSSWQFIVRRLLAVRRLQRIFANTGQALQGLASSRLLACSKHLRD